MLEFILGEQKTGKTKEIYNRIDKLTLENKEIVLIVPEQISFETEKNLYTFLTAKRMRNVLVTNFKHLSQEIFKLYGGLKGEYANNYAKEILIQKALADVSDELCVYKKSAKKQGFASIILKTIEEIKNSGLTVEEFKEKIMELPEGNLKEKSFETAKIYEIYDGLLNERYKDNIDDIRRAALKLKTSDFFKDKIVYLDEFTSFSGTQYDMLKEIMKQSAETCVSLCLNLEKASNNKLSVYSLTFETYNKLKKIALEENLTVKAPFKLTEKHYISQELSVLNDNIFENTVKKYPEKTNNIMFLTCNDEYQEISFTLSKIKALIENGYRYNDIAIVARDLDTYKNKIKTECKRYNIPYYMDETVSITSKPIVRFIYNSLVCAQRNYNSENMLSLLKCGVTPYSSEEVGMLENYVYVYNINKKKWLDEFKSNPGGFKIDFTDYEKNELVKVNEMREFLVNSVNNLKAKTKDKTVEEIIVGIGKFLEETKTTETLSAIINAAAQEGNYEKANDYKKSYELMCEVFLTMTKTIGNTKLNLDDFVKLFSETIKLCDMGTIPQSLDCLIVGSAERIRLTDKKVIFVLGANENIFPMIPGESGIFTDKEKETLKEANINISDSVTEKIRNERFICLRTLGLPSEKLFITCRKMTSKGEEQMPSEVKDYIEEIFDNAVLKNYSEIQKSDLIKTKQTAFKILTEEYENDTKLRSTLKEYLNEDIEYKGKIESIDMYLDNKSYQIKNKDLALDLFGKTVYASPTRVENFYKCKFKYFIEFGLNINPLRKADLDSMQTGTIIHKVLCDTLQNDFFDKPFDEEKTKIIIEKSMNEYITDVMGGQEDKTARFKYLFNRISKSMMTVIKRVYDEITENMFVPELFEYEISDKSDVKPIEIFSDDKKTSIKLRGIIDRVDVYKAEDNKEYVRIVDYKSGPKKFNLNDVVKGLNLQMLIYLNAIEKSKTGAFKNAIPSGILYMPVGEISEFPDRYDGEDKIKDQKQKEYCMNGLLVDDIAVLNAMECDLNGIFIPVKLKKDGTPTKNSQEKLVTLSELGKINTYIESLVKQMLNKLSNGNIEAMPVEKVCDYCEYKAVCKKEDIDNVIKIAAEDKITVLKEISNANEGKEM